MPSSAARMTSSGMRQAPSPNEKVVCVCRWTKLTVTAETVHGQHRTARPTRARVLDRLRGAHRWLRRRRWARRAGRIRRRSSFVLPSRRQRRAVRGPTGPASELPLERPRLGEAVVAQVDDAAAGAHPPVRAADVAVVLPPARLEDPRLEDALDPVRAAAPDEGDRAPRPLVPADGDGDGLAVGPRAAGAGPGGAGAAPAGVGRRRSPAISPGGSGLSPEVAPPLGMWGS